MAFPNLTFTDEGKALQVKAMNGDSIIFTKIALGNGEEPSDISALTALNNQLYVCGITNFENHTTYAIIHWFLDSQSVSSEFEWTEYGLFAKDSNNNEVLYAYAYDSNPQTIPSGDDSSITQIESDLNIALGDAENVSAVIGEYSAYASKEVVNEHISNNQNPHNVTKEQVGLGDVDNVSTDNATPSFTASNSLQELVSGEKLSVLFGKLKTAVKALIDHIANTNNPHGITLAKIGAAASSHSHNASAINAGVLSAARGGTGYSSIDSMLSAFGLANAKIHYFSGRAPDGGFEIIFKNKMVIGCGNTGAIYAEANSNNGFSIDFGANYFVAAPIVVVSNITAVKSRHASVSGITRRGWDITYFNQSNTAASNSVNYIYMGFVTNLP